MDRKVLSAMAVMAVSGIAMGFGIVAVYGQTTQQSASSERLETPLDVANKLDAIIQQRFLTIDDKFGMSRIIKLSGHDGVRYFPQTEEEKRSMEQVRSAQRSYVMGFWHVARPIASRTKDQHAVRTTIPPRTLGPDSRLTILTWSDPTLNGQVDRRKFEQLQAEKAPTFKAMEAVATALRERVVSGRAFDKDGDDWLYALRPVRASRIDCLGCHNGSRKGDTLGVMVYAVSKRTVSHE